jgi:hypothetical protein
MGQQEKSMDCALSVGYIRLAAFLDSSCTAAGQTFSAVQIGCFLSVFFPELPEK